MDKTIVFAALFLASSALGSTVVVDSAHSRRPISADVYGLNGGEDAQLARMGISLRGRVGNGMARFNWKSSTTNTGGDGKFFQNRQIETADAFIATAATAGAASMVELPLIGYLAQEINPGLRHCGFSVAKYGAQQSVDPTDADCGIGVGLNQQLMVNDPLDISLPASEAWTREWVTHLVSRFGPGGVRFYSLGNHPALWHETHRDIHPAKASYAEIKARLLAHARAVKDVDPSALTLGPGAWGWLEYFDSAAGDRASSGMEFIPFYLKTAAAAEVASQHRLLDYLDIHVYPQAAGVAAGATTPEVNAARLRSTKILWDPTYVVESWETCCNGNGVLKIVPRMREWITANYPGTKLAISGYGFGAIDAVNGALAQVDALGIFGREGVDLATLETAPTAGSIGEDAFKLFRNYDGSGGRFGDTSVKATSSAPDSLAAFASFDKAGHVTVVLLNKETGATDVASLKFEGVGTSGRYRAFEFGANGRLAPAGTGDVKDGTLTRAVLPSTAVLIEYTPVAGIGPGAIDTPADLADAGLAPGPAAAPKASGCSTTGSAAMYFALLALAALALRHRRPGANVSG